MMRYQTSSKRDSASQSMPWFVVGMVGVLLLSLALHFWGLGRFNTLVFDEVYYVKYAHNYLTHTPFFDAHPPLGKYAIALALWISSHFPIGRAVSDNLAGVPFSPLSYRWLNALTGSLLPLVVGAIAYQISHRRSYALIAALFTTCDGLFLIESRYALINIYLIFFGLLGQWLFLLALEYRGRQRWLFLALSGINFGAAVSVKWNGLGFLLGIYLVWIFAWIVRWVQRSRTAPDQRFSNPQFPLQNLTQLNLGQVIFNLSFIPALVYRLLWIPHLQINTKVGFWGLHKQLLGFHQGLANGPSVHPYCSNWYTWPLMLRPMSYFYETTRNFTEPVPSVGPSLPADAVKIVYSVHAMGNPFLWWLSTLAMLLLMMELLARIGLGMDMFGRASTYGYPSIQGWVTLYLVLNYAANLLPWIKVSRCTFIYLYMGAVVFGFLAIAWLVDWWLASIKPRLRSMGVTTIFLILLAFVFWLPIYLGLPLPLQDFHLRMWLRSWY